MRKLAFPMFMISWSSLVIVNCSEHPDSISTVLDAEYDLGQQLAKHGEAERIGSARSIDFAYGSADSRLEVRYPWPVAVKSIGHTNASYQNYGGAPYFHHGLDIRADDGEVVRASAGGKVVNIENYIPGDPAYWEVAILDDQGFLWQYHHIDRNSIPSEVFAALKSGEPVSSGAGIGKVYRWSVRAFGELFHHIHLNILDGSGKYLSPFDFLDFLPDDKSPEIVDIGLLKNGRKHSGSKVSGVYSLFATVHDLILHERFVVPPHLLTYRIDDYPPSTLWHFAQLPGGASREMYVEKFFVPSLTCGNYDCRKLTVDLGFTKSGARSFPATVGEHRIEITATDYVGNSISKMFTWSVE